MSEERGFLIGPQLREKLKTTISRVEAMPLGAPLSRIPTRFEDGSSYVPKTFHVCTFTGTWAINTEKSVTFRGVTSTPNTISATNLFAAITASSSARNCAIAKDGTAWYLIAAQC